MIRRLLTRGITGIGLLLFAEVAYAVLRPARRQAEFDPSGRFGDPGLPPIRVAVLGDSSVTGPGVAEASQIWVSRLCSRLGEHRHVQLRSYAVGGAKASDLIRDQLEPALAYRPHIALVAVGANDCIRGVRPSHFEARLDHIVARLVESGAQVVLSGVGDLGTIPRLQPPLRRLISRRSLVYDRIHREIAATRGATVVDHRSDEPDLWYRDRSLWSPDLFHVSAAGHLRWADVTWRTLQPLLAELDGSS